MKTLYFDLESSSLPSSYLDTIKPQFEANKTLKDPEKIRLDLANKEAAWRERAALDSTTGQVLVIGTLDGDTPTFIEGGECSVLKRFWDWANTQLGMGNLLVGFSIFNFDLRFAGQRSWINGVTIPMGIRRSSYKPWNEGLVDIAEQWQLGNRDQYISLDMLARVLGIPGKLGEGKDFANLYATDRAAALAYLAQDLRICQAAYRRMNPV